MSQIIETRICMDLHHASITKTNQKNKQKVLIHASQKTHANAIYPAPALEPERTAAAAA